QRYKDYCKRQKTAPTTKEVETQTHLQTLKEKGCGIRQPSSKDASVECSIASIFDAQNADTQEEDRAAAAVAAVGGELGAVPTASPRDEPSQSTDDRGDTESTYTMSLTCSDAGTVVTKYTSRSLADVTLTASSTVSAITVDSGVLPEEDMEDRVARMRRERAISRVLHDPSLVRRLLSVEQIVVQSAYYKLLRDYRCEDIETKNAAKLQISGLNKLSDVKLVRLWSYTSGLSRGRPVTCFSWNPSSKDLIAIGYGSSRNVKHSAIQPEDGLVLLWSPINPAFHQYHMKFSSPVTCVAFSNDIAALLAVGLADGRVMVVNVSENETDMMGNVVPLLSSSPALHKHTDKVTEIEWIGNDLISVSLDGRITKRSLRLSLQPSELLKLRVVVHHPQATRGVKPQTGMKRISGGVCLSMHPTEKGMFVVGTDDGCSHIASSSYIDQFMETFTVHTSQVVCAQFHHWCPNYVLSASHDDTVKVCMREKHEPMLTMNVEQLVGGGWIPHTPLGFYTLTPKEILIWDLPRGIEKGIPLASFDASAPCVRFGDADDLAEDEDIDVEEEEKAVDDDELVHTLTAVTVAPGRNVLLVGDSNGGVHVLRLRGYGERDLDDLAEVKEERFYQFMSQFDESK
ncbi:hypothetical protein ADUPG1_011139, partial [Aduncisulcus paluster]